MKPAVSRVSTRGADPAGFAAPRAGQALPQRAHLPGRWHGLTVAVVVTAAAIVRVLVLRSPFSWLDGDEAVTGVMAQRIAGGEAFLYFGGNGYLGAAEQYLQAPLLLLGPTDPFLLRLPQVAMGTASCYLVYLLGRRLLRSDRMAMFAAACFALGPFFNVVYGTKSKVAAGPLLLGLLGLLLATSTAASPTRERRTFAGFGLCAGLGFWLNWSSAFLLVPAGLWLAGSRRLRPRLAGVAAAGFALGSVPFWMVLVGGRLPLFVGMPTMPSSPAQRGEALFGPVLAMLLGLRLPPPAGAGEPALAWMPPALGVAVALAVLGATAWQRREGIVAILRGRAHQADPLDLLPLSFLIVPLPYIAASFSWQTADPRYLYPLYGLLPLALAGLVQAAVPPQRAMRVTAAVGICGVLALTTGAALRLAYENRIANGGTALSGAALELAVDVLEEEGHSSAWAGFWTAYPLQFAAGERLQVASFHDPVFLDTEARVRSDPSPAYVARAEDGGDMAAALRGAGSSFRRRDVAGLAIFLDVQPRLAPTIPALGPLDAGLTRY